MDFLKDFTLLLFTLSRSSVNNYMRKNSLNIDYIDTSINLSKPLYEDWDVTVLIRTEMR